MDRPTPLRGVGRALNDRAQVRSLVQLRAALNAGRSAWAGRSINGVVQRDVGFEYETNVDSYLAAAPLTGPQRRSAAIPPGALPIGKGQTIVGDIGGLHAKADQAVGGAGAGVGSDLELETDHFPETPAGRGQLHVALKNLERFCGLIESKRAETPHMSSAHLATAFGGNAPVPGRHIRAAGAVTGSPQVTAGIRLDKIEELMERTVGGPAGGAFPVGAGAAHVRLELGALNVQDFRSVGDAPSTVRAQLATYMGVAPPLPAGFPSADLVGLSALILTYINRGLTRPAYAKQIAPLMARTDLGAIFQALPPPEFAFLAAGGGAHFVAMFTQILAGVPGGIAGQLFSLEPADLVAAPVMPTVSTSLTRQAWIASISQNNDLLTTARFPSVPARPEMQGLGQLGATMDPVPAGGAGGARPILELRRMLAGVQPHAMTEIAMGVFDYVVALNAAAAAPAAPYARVARGPKTPTFAQKLRYWTASR